MAKFHKYKHSETQRGYLFHCPGCKDSFGHFVLTTGKGPIWEVSKVVDDKPTVMPSIRVRSRNAEGETICHSFIKDGKIQFLNDCTHELAGQTVELPDFKGNDGEVS
jgi:hypothetical protein